MRFGVIGIGTVGPINVRALMAMPGVEIVAVANRTVSKAQTLCRELGLSCPVYGNWQELIQKEKPDAVVINLYNDMHHACFMACARAGIHILVEKPLANTYADCLEMIQAAQENGIRATVLQTQRYGSVLQTAKAYIKANASRLGQLLCVSDQINCRYFYESRSPWHLDPVRSGGGIVLNYGVHQLDRVHWLLEQKTVRFHAGYLTKQPGVDTVSSYTMLGIGDRGTPYTVTCNGYTGPWINEILLNFAGGVVKCMVMDCGEWKKGVYASLDDGSLKKVPPVCDDGDGHGMYCREMEAALAYLTGKTECPPVSLEWGAEMVRLCCQGFSE